MCVFEYIYICVFEYIYIFFFKFIYMCIYNIYIQTHIYMYIHYTCIYVCMCVYMYVCIYKPHIIYLNYIGIHSSGQDSNPGGSGSKAGEFGKNQPPSKTRAPFMRFALPLRLRYVNESNQY